MYVYSLLKRVNNLKPGAAGLYGPTMNFHAKNLFIIFMLRVLFFCPLHLNTYIHVHACSSGKLTSACTVTHMYRYTHVHVHVSEYMYTFREGEYSPLHL